MFSSSSSPQSGICPSRISPPRIPLIGKSPPDIDTHKTASNTPISTPTSHKHSLSFQADDTESSIIEASNYHLALQLLLRTSPFTSHYSRTASRREHWRERKRPSRDEMDVDDVDEDFQVRRGQWHSAPASKWRGWSLMPVPDGHARFSCTRIPAENSSHSPAAQTLSPWGCVMDARLFSRLKSLIPGAEYRPSFERNESQQYEARMCMLCVDKIAGALLPIAAAHGEGRAVFDSPQDLENLEARGGVAVRYADNELKQTGR